jgi:anti-sigma factor RsiW
MTRLDDTTDDAMQERLNAYLDGELPADEARAVEERLSSDPAWAAELQRLERAWNLLDQLPRSEAAPNFTQTTVEMIALHAAEDLQEAASPRPRRRWLDGALVAAGALAAALAGYLTITHLRPQRDDAMLHELPVLKHLDLYSRSDPGESAEFLRLLRREPPLTPIPHRDGR